MGKEFHRNERVGEELQRLLAEVIREELDDPRLRLLTITEVRVSRDLSHARVFFSSMEDDIEHTAITDSLERAAGFLRGELGRRLTMRSVPKLHFEYDESVQRGQRLRSLIDEARASDRLRSQANDDD